LSWGVQYLAFFYINFNRIIMSSRRADNLFSEYIIRSFKAKSFLILLYQIVKVKERRNFGQLFIIVILFNWYCFPNRKTLKKMFNVFKLNKSDQFIFTLPFKSPETLKILEGDICKFSYGSNP